jgi:hypothetical protein
VSLSYKKWPLEGTECWAITITGDMTKEGLTASPELEISPSPDQADTKWLVFWYKHASTETAGLFGRASAEAPLCFREYLGMENVTRKKLTAGVHVLQRKSERCKKGS